MRINILVPADHLEAAKAEVIQTIPGLADHVGTLSIGLSPTGEEPATHWYCTMNVMKHIFDQLLAARKYSIMEEGEIRPFLKAHGLKPVK